MASPDRPEAGELWLVRFGAAEVGEPSKNRPALVLSDSSLLSGSVYDLVIVVPVSATMTPALSRPHVAAGDGLDVDSVAVPRAVRAVTLARLLRRLGTAPEPAVDEVRRVLADLIGLDATPR
jgi:mRNA interferase MazF